MKRTSVPQLQRELQAHKFNTKLELDFALMKSPLDTFGGYIVPAVTRRFGGDVQELIAEIQQELDRVETNWPHIKTYGVHLYELLQSPSERTMYLLRYAKTAR